MGLSAGQTSHNSLQKSALNINGKISTKTALVLPSSTCTTPNQPWPTRIDQRGQAMRPADLLPTTACASHPIILNQPDLHMTMVPQPPSQHSPQVGVFASALRCWPLSPLRKPRTSDVVVSIKARRRSCQRWSHAVRQHQCRAAWAPPGLHSKHAHSALDLCHVTNQPTHASGPTSCSSSSSAWSRRSRVQDGLRIVAGVFATFANSVSHTFAVDRMTSAPPKPISHGV